MIVLPFAIVDVFATEPLAGNPLAVVEGGVSLPLASLQRIAREFNQSETTFVLPPTRPAANFRLRSFTAAGVEVFGAGGHNTLGAWWWLAQAGKLALSGDETPFHQEIGDRVLPVVVARQRGELTNIVMTQEQPSFGKRVEDLEPLALSLGLPSAALVTDRLACQAVSTGVAHLMVPVRGRDAVDRIRPDAKALLSILESVDAEGCYAFSLDPARAEAAAYARFFNPTVGISEDPATGTAAGPLAVHLSASGLMKTDRIRIEQGTALGRTSLIEVEVSNTAVRVCGRSVVVAAGQLVLPG
jgi:trans-2,3-dihydro-3-hydroxyanthranilate isomerase